MCKGGNTKDVNMDGELIILQIMQLNGFYTSSELRVWGKWIEVIRIKRLYKNWYYEGVLRSI